MATETNSQSLAVLTANNVESFLEKHHDAIAKSLPKHLTPDRMLRIALTEIRKVPKLLSCDPASLLGAIIQSSQLGLEFGVIGHAYLIPYGKECQLILGYKGLMELVRRSGKIVNIQSHAVYSGDVFEYEYGSTPKVKHHPAIKDRGEIIGAYAIAFFKSGEKPVFEFMSKEEIDKIRAGSKMPNSAPWTQHYEQMAKKTAIRRLCKYLPLSPELQAGMELDDRADLGESQSISIPIEAEDAEFTESVPDGEGRQIHPGTGEVQSDPTLPGFEKL